MTAPPVSLDVPTPDPVREMPPDDRYCDLVLNGGVASGVVYPWAVVELARHYRFRNIGGNSVGALAAALAAAAEYGRCQGYGDAFEVLRRAPLELAEERNGRSGMLRLFQPGPGLNRLFELLLVFVDSADRRPGFPRKVWAALALYGLRRWLLLVPALLVVSWASALLGGEPLSLQLVAGLLPLGLGLLGCFVVVVAVALHRLLSDLRVMKDHDFGLCSGRAQPTAAGDPPTEKALVEWLHEGIQRSAQRDRHDPPLTFADLWHAPRAGLPQSEGPEPPAEKSIGLEMFSTNITLGRPVRWPLLDRNTRLFFKPSEWERLFPPTLLNAVRAASAPYTTEGAGDPTPDPSDPEQFELMRTLREIPAGAMPIAVAARLSLSFPLLFTSIPVYAIDYEMPHGRRSLRQCWLTDGGVCTNFPIHLFDAAHPRWPTFGLMLSRRLQYFNSQAIWLPERHREGRADNWQRIVPGAAREPQALRPPLLSLIGLLFGMVTTALNWSDNLTSRLPHARNRVLRMALKREEGQLNIDMPGTRILDMAHRYGTLGGKRLIERFVSGTDTPTVAWREHLYVRAMVQLRALRKHLRGYRRAAESSGHTTPMADIVAQAAKVRPLRAWPGRAHEDNAGAKLNERQAAALQAAVDAVAALEQALDQPYTAIGPYQSLPPAELRLQSLI